ncbi:MAG: hypothetical protein M1825_006075 [Sarcosagium campestre]|nr:MAG: hypothetical protein M1825_006075 [Sarcosagium campestre]
MAQKKKKNAPDKLQPAWLFPPDEENPVLNPKLKSPEELKKEKEEKERAVKWLNHRAVSTPVKTAPPPHLLNLIAIFLTEYGFGGTCRLFNIEREGRKHLEGWNDDIGEKIDKKGPGLLTIYKDWKISVGPEQHQSSSDESSSSSDEPERIVKQKDKKSPGSKKLITKSSISKKVVVDVSTSSSGSDTDSADSGVTAKGSTLPKKSISMRPTKISKSSSSASSSASSSSTSQDSDADDEEAVTRDESKIRKEKSAKPSVLPKSASLKRKASPEPKTSLDKRLRASSKDVKVSDIQKSKSALAEPSATAVVAKRASKKSVAAVAVSSTQSDSNSSSASSSSSSSKELERGPKTTTGTSVRSTKTKVTEASTPSDKIVALPRTSSTDSSVTIEGEVKKVPSSSDDSSSSNSNSSTDSSSEEDESNSSIPTPTEAPPKPTKRKRSQSPRSNDSSVGAKRPKASVDAQKSNKVPFSRIPANIKVEEKLSSNAYVPYEYADRAHQDLIVTRGKGFTKEKNKKKRGSYRGGPIDTNSRKGIKFDD